MSDYIVVQTYVGKKQRKSWKWSKMVEKTGSDSNCFILWQRLHVIPYQGSIFIFVGSCESFDERQRSLHKMLLLLLDSRTVEND